MLNAIPQTSTSESPGQFLTKRGLKSYVKQSAEEAREQRTIARLRGC